MLTLVETCKQNAVDEMEQFLRKLSKVPDDKLTWSPTPTAKTSIRIAAHTALYAGRFARMLEARALPQPENLQEWLEKRDAEEKAVTTREEVEAAFRKGTNEVLAALDSLTPEEIESRLESGQGWSAPMTWLMNLPANHTGWHAAQIDYLQTCWDDQEVYF